MLDFTEDIHKFPFIRFLIPLIGGIILAIYLPEKYIPGINWMVFAGLGVLVLLSFGIKISAHRYRLWFGLIMHLFFLILGIFLVQARVNKNERFLDFINNGPVVGTVLRRPAERAKTFKVLIKTEFVKKDSVWEPLNFKSLVYFEKEIGVKKLKPGDKIVLFSNLQEFNASGNPGEFNYSRYLSDRGVLSRIYVKDNQWSKFGETNDHSILVLSAKLRHYAFQLFRENELTDDALQVLSALLLGQREYIRDELKDSFSNAGITHVMAVSGLHVGIIYIILFYLLFFLDRIKYGKAIRSMVIILILWFYAFIAGLSPSVVRAVIMFSFISIGQGLKREVNVYNSLAVAAFVLLCMNPFYLRDVGFQLSFLAVLGIVLLYPKLYPLLASKYWLPDKAWMLVSVSLAAQFATFPLILFYFAQFPNYFILTNLVAIPLVTIILYLGLSLLAFSFSLFISKALTLLLNGIVSSLVFVVEKVGDLPYAITKPVYVDSVGVIWLFLFIFFIVFFIYYKKAWLLNISLGFILLFLSWNLFKTYQANKQKFITVMNVSGKSLIQFTNGREAFLLHNAETIDDIEKIKYAVNSYSQVLRLKNIHWYLLGDTSILPENSQLYYKYGFFRFFNIDGYLGPGIQRQVAPGNNRLPIDLLIVSGNSKKHLKKYLNYFETESVVIDSSVPAYFSKYLINDCNSFNVNYFSVRGKGAFIYNLQKNGVE